MKNEIEKLDAAQEQLITAIDLWFRDVSPVAIHTLVRASHEILDSLCKKKGLEESVVSEGLKQLVKPEHHQKVIKKLNETKNFFKHADRDPDEKISWDNELSEYYMWDACNLLNRVSAGKKIKCEILVYQLIFRIQNSNLWEEPSELDKLIPDAKKELGMSNKKDVFDMLVKKCQLQSLASSESGN